MTHPDYKKLCDAGERMESIASDINLKIRESETASHLAALLSRGSSFARLNTDVCVVSTIASPHLASKSWSVACMAERWFNFECV